MRRLPPLLVLVALGCQSSEAAKGTDHTFKDQGRICAFPEGTDPGNAFAPPSGPVTFEANRTATITVRAPTCLSSSCSKDARADCTAMLSGNVLQVTSSASFRQEGEVCTDDCGALVARCTTPPLPAGTWFLQHGADRIVLMVPSTGPVPCAGQGF